MSTRLENSSRFVEGAGTWVNWIETDPDRLTRLVHEARDRLRSSTTMVHPISNGDSCFEMLQARLRVLTARVLDDTSTSTITTTYHNSHDSTKSTIGTIADDFLDNIVREDPPSFYIGHRQILAIPVVLKHIHEQYYLSPDDSHNLRISSHALRISVPRLTMAQCKAWLWKHEGGVGTMSRSFQYIFRTYYKKECKFI